MKKTLIALTLAALPVAAMADVTLYGQMKAGVEVTQVKLGDKTAAKVGTDDTSLDGANIADFGSRIGFKGHEHLSDNLNAIWQIEQTTSVAGGGEWGTRESFIGLEGNWGKVRAGKLDSTIKNNDAVDPWEYDNYALGMGVFTRNDDRYVSVRYDSPVFSGFSASVQYSPRDNQSDADKYFHRAVKEDGSKGDLGRDTYFAGLNYENSGYFAQYSGGFRKNAVNAGDDGQLHRLTVGYDANNLFVAVAGQYGKDWETLNHYASAQSAGFVGDEAADDAANTVFGTDSTLGEKGVEATEVAATVAYRFGNLTPRASYAHGFKAKVDGDKLDGTQYDQVVIGADYDFSKRTTALVSAGWLRGGESGAHKVETVAGLVGLRHKF